MANPIGMWGIGNRRTEVADGRYILHYDRVASTMDAARNLVSKGDSKVIAVSAGYQTKGRGRRGGQWVAQPDTCLLITYILPPMPSITFDAQQVSFAAGVVVAECISTFTDGDLSTQLKWPNDVIINGKKIAGVLIELAHSTDGNSAIPLVGIGINVNVPSFPSEIASRATSIELETGLLSDIETIEHEIRTRLFETIRKPWSEVLGLWRQYDVTNGISYTSDIDGETVIGTAVGVSDTGALILRVGDTTVETVAATSSMSYLP